MGVRVEQFANREPVGGFRRRERGVNGQVHGQSFSRRSVSTISTTKALEGATCGAPLVQRETTILSPDTTALAVALVPPG